MKLLIFFLFFTKSSEIYKKYKNTSKNSREYVESILLERKITTSNNKKKDLDKVYESGKLEVPVSTVY